MARSGMAGRLYALIHTFKPQKLFRATNSFYKAGCALIPVISSPEGRRMTGKKHLPLIISNMVVARCLFFFFFLYSSESIKVEEWWCLQAPEWVYTPRHTPFLEEMSLASSSLRLARESAFSSGRGTAFSGGAERLCRRWGSPKVWVSASSRATQHRYTKMHTKEYDRYESPLWNQSMCLSFVRGLGLKLVPSEGAERERWPSSVDWEERGSPKQLVHRTTSTTHTHSPAVIWNAQGERGERSTRSLIRRIFRCSPAWINSAQICHRTTTETICRTTGLWQSVIALSPQQACESVQHIHTVIQGHSTQHNSLGHCG